MGQGWWLEVGRVGLGLEVGWVRVGGRAGVIPALESASESDFGSFWTTNLSDSGSGSFTLESLESAPVLEPIQTVKIAWKSPFLLCEN